jgi:hypothetical protein
VEQPVEPSAPAPIVREDYEFLTGLIHMEHSR